MNVKQIDEKIAADRRVKEATARVEKIAGQQAAAQDELDAARTALADAESQQQSEIIAGRDLDRAGLARLRSNVAEAESSLGIYTTSLAEARKRRTAAVETVRQELLAETKRNYRRAIGAVDEAYAA